MTDQHTFDRRGMFRIGGLTVGLAALVAACGDTEAGEIGTVGEGQGNPELEAGTVDNGTLLRTMASVEHSIATAYQRIIDDAMLADGSSTYTSLGDQSELVALYAAHHTAAADTYNELAVAGGAAAWECGNPRLDAVFIEAIFHRVTDGADATDIAPAIGPSDDPGRDIINLVHTLESLSAASAQAVVNHVTEAPIRVAAMEIGVRSGRQAALLALRINPGGYVSSTDAAAAQVAAPTTTAAPTTVQDIATAETVAGEEAAPPPTEIPLPVAVPTQFGSVGAITYIGGAGDENGVRMRLNFETPSLNSFVYSFTEYGECMPADTEMATPTT